MEELGKLKKSNGLIGNRTRDLSDFSVVPQQRWLVKDNFEMTSRETVVP
jgi:hypothetical protein